MMSGCKWIPGLSGEVSERLKELVSKTSVAPSVTVGSNPTLSVEFPLTP